MTYYFLKKSLTSTGFNQKTSSKIVNGYITGVGGILAATLLLALLPPTEVSCDKNLFSFHWFILDTVDIVNSLLILFSSYYILK